MDKLERPSEVVSASMVEQLRMAYSNLLRKTRRLVYLGIFKVKKHVEDMGRKESGELDALLCS